MLFSKKCGQKACAKKNHLKQSTIITTTHLIRHNRLETPAIVPELIPLLVHLNPLPVVLDLCVEAVGAFLHGLFHRLARLCLWVGHDMKRTTFFFSL